MAHYAFIDENNIVTETIVGKDETDLSENWEEHYAQFRPGMRCLRYSYNTLNNSHLLGGTPFRGNAAFPGAIYNEEFDVFLIPKLHPDLILNTEKFIWEPPTPKPDSGFWRFDLESFSWVESDV